MDIPAAAVITNRFLHMEYLLSEDTHRHGERLPSDAALRILASIRMRRRSVRTTHHDPFRTSHITSDVRLLSASAPPAVMEPVDEEWPLMEGECPVVKERPMSEERPMMESVSRPHHV